MKDKDVLNLLIEIGSIISEMFGENCEVAISQDKKIVAIFNGHVSNRQVGSKLDPEAEERINHARNGYYLNFAKKNIDSPSQNLKAATLCLELDGKMTSFSINYDNSEVIKLINHLKDFLEFNGHEELSSQSEDKIRLDFEKAASKLAKPIHLLNKEDRLKLTQNLYDMGTFNYKNSIPKVARLMGVTRFTIYNYFKELGIDLTKKKEKE